MRKYVLHRCIVAFSISFCCLVTNMCCSETPESNLCETQDLAEELNWPKPVKENRPGCIWWWMGSAVDKDNIIWNLEQMRKAGIGGATIVCIYGVKGEEDCYIELASDEWFDIVRWAARQAAARDMWLDMTPGSGWPFGGPGLPDEYTSQQMQYKNAKLNINCGVQNVKRAAPAGQGKVLNPFYPEAMDFYMKRFERGLADAPFKPRAFYHDSFEYYNCNYSPVLFSHFKQHRRYDLQNYLDSLFAEQDDEQSIRIKADFRKTIHELHLAYLNKWVLYSSKLGIGTRNQAHGAPANLLDAYAAAGIPETETFGNTAKVNIPGYLFEKQHIRSGGNYEPMASKFASSAAHVAGKPFVACESCTWLRNHFNTALWHLKPVIDELFINGINHIFYHGTCYSPKDADWPGWLFYASVQFNERNAFWRDFPSLNRYVTRCQSILQSAKPAEDFIVYWAVEDLWHKSSEPMMYFKIHSSFWFNEIPFGRTVTALQQAGYSCDFISDALIEKLTVKQNKIASPGSEYKAVIIPPLKYMPNDTLKNLLNLAENGATVIFESLPCDVPGFKDFQQRKLKQKQILEVLKFEKTGNDKLAQIGNGNVYLTEDLISTIQSIGIDAEGIVNFGVPFVKCKHDDGFYYFVSNFKSGKNLDDWITMGTPVASAVLMDPDSGRVGLAQVRDKNGKTQIYLQLMPGQSIIIKTFTDKKITARKWEYVTVLEETFTIDSPWQVDFIEGGPVLPASMTMKTLQSWTANPDKEARRFAGTARYKTTFELPEYNGDDWLLDLGTVRDSAVIKVNGRNAGTAWSLPFKIRIGKYLKKGKNILEIELTNLSANRIRDLDIRGVNWKKFHDINFVDQNYKEFDASKWPLRDSGLLGPVTLTALKLKTWP